MNIKMDVVCSMLASMVLLLYQSGTDSSQSANGAYQKKENRTTAQFMRRCIQALVDIVSGWYGYW